MFRNSDSLERLSRIDSVLRWLRSCAICHSIRPPISLVCDRCAEKLDVCFNRQNELKQPGYPFPVYSLITWTDENDHLVRPLLHGFKGGWPIGATEKWMELLSHLRSGHDRVDFPRFVFPPPSKSGSKDHSWLLANLLASSWERSKPICLSRVGNDSASEKQKTKSAAERTRRRFASIESEKITYPEATWVFVDDVITTGSTAMAAYMALGDPDRFEAWTLACRPKLAGKSGI